MRVCALAALLPLAACSDRLTPSDDRWGQSGALIAVSGGEGGARYACIQCHGARGEGNGFDAPRLAGLPAGYLQKQMEDFAAGLRPHEVMRDVARFLDSHERVQVANHYAALPVGAQPAMTASSSTVATVVQRHQQAHSERADAATAALYAQRCAQCHGTDALGTPAGPPLAAQPALYLAQQLQDWQVSKRRNDSEHAMLSVAQLLSAHEVRHLSRYLAASPPPPARPGR